MKDLISNVVDIIGEYNNSIQVGIDEHHISRWITQFAEDDREFILSELKFLLDKCYITESKAVQYLKMIVPTLKKKFKYKEVSELLNNTLFVRCQEDHKSQSVFLDIFDKILEENYQVKLVDCGKNSTKHIVYIDDILATGGTLARDIEKLIDDKVYLTDSDQSITFIFMITHTWALNKRSFPFRKKFKINIYENTLSLKSIQNNSLYSPSSLDLIYPKESEIGKLYLEQRILENTSPYKMTQRDHAFRSKDKPNSENFFSSPENRDRYESIILEKGIHIINNCSSVKNNIRPLGVINPSYATLGTGTHYFTWRNISNTCPLVFWWGGCNNRIWFPLFPQANRGE